ncbi:serine/threonine protein phosphatase [Shewanella sp. VB17]|uniref:lipopolysaccharide kinase InaA family protein n=1 Tax=Shewanella sp. VB17 TaxID=2739432 RepID=UPI00156633E5|nr:lipopolysaccharide kinase InaA family protein [Shewanella sp. VB17]NRD73549.1 serine/threonine protein phosphatase [Shewanella sp. VB17]
MPNQAFRCFVDNVLNDNIGKRVVRFEYSGQVYWLKQAEKLTGAMRFLKPNSKKSIQIEIDTLKKLALKGAPVPTLMYCGDHFLVIADVGKTLNEWMANANIESNTQQQILVDSGVALAKLHTLGLAHGRPALRDISWQDGQVSFIDFEASQNNKSIIYQQRRDILVYIHSLYRYLGPKHESIKPVIMAYRHAGGDNIWQEAKKWITPWQCLYFVLYCLKDVGGKDLRPIYWLLWHFRQTK